MTEAVSLKKNFIMNALLTMSAFIFPLITFPYVSRVLGPDGTGRVSFGTSLISYFALFSQLGIPTYGVRACAKVRDDREALSRTVRELLSINAVMCAFTYVIFFAALVLIPRLHGDRMLYIIMSSTLLFNAFGMEWLYKGLEKYSYITIRSIAFKIVSVIAMFLLVHQKSDYVVYGAITVFAASASQLMNFFHAHKYIDLKSAGRLDFRHHLRSIGIFFAMACATTIYLHLDVVMLGFMTTDTDTGYYNAAVRIKQILVSIVTSLGTVLLPRASYYVELGKKEDFRRITGKALHFVALIAVPVTVYFMLYAAEGIYFLSGPAYTGSIAPMQLIMPTVIFIGLTNIMGIQVLVPLGREKIVLYSEIAGAITDLILNAILIPRMQSAGAAIGTLAAEFVVLLVQYAALRDENIGAQLRKIPFGAIVIATLLAVAGSIWTRHIQVLSSNTWNSFVILAVSAVLFFGIYVLFLTIRREPMMLEVENTVFKKLIKR